MNKKNKLTIEIYEEPNKIIKYLNLGTNIPIFSSFHKYILHDLMFFNAKSLILSKNNKIIGNCIIFSDDNLTLYFGFFGVMNHNPNYIKYLLEQVINYATDNNFQEIRGPINIPTVIYGWGFLKEGSKDNLFVAKPVNPPIYQNIFYSQKFYIKYEEVSLEGIMPRLNPWRMKQYNFDDYELINPEDFDDLKNYKEIFLKLHANNLPPSAVLTPSIDKLFDNYTEYIFQFGYNFMIYLVRFKPTGRIVACGSSIPNPFSKDEKGNYNTISFHTWVVESEHRGKGLSMLMYGAASMKAWKSKIRYSLGPVGGDNTVSMNAAKKLGALEGRTHLILEKILT